MEGVDLGPIIVYFKNTWGPRAVLGIRPNICNYYDCVGYQINKDVEGFNRKVNRTMHDKNPSIYKFSGRGRGVNIRMVVLWC